MRLTRFTFALAIAGAMVAGAAGATAGYWLLHQAPESVERADFKVEVAPTEPGGAYVVYVPIPAERDGTPAAGFGLLVLDGAPRFGLVQSEHGMALRIAGEGPAKLVAQGPLPVRLSLDDVSFAFRQFKFWAYLDRDASGPVLLKVEVRASSHHADWDVHRDNSKAIVVQEPLEPKGWQVVRATQLFDIAYGAGYGDNFPRIALGALATGLAGLYAPLSMVAVGAWRQRKAAARGVP